MIPRAVLVVLLLFAATAAILWMTGPREPVDTTITFDAGSIGPDVEAYLARGEAQVPDLRPEAAKEIVWAYPASKARTPLAIVYVHGFSATKAETRPLADEIARALGANLFYTRLSGHGRDSAAMAEPSVNDWMNDLAEGLAIGRAIGNRVVVIGASTGGALGILAAAQPDLAGQMSALVLLSPNLRLVAPNAYILDLPWARRILSAFGEESYGFEPANAAHAAGWTTRYPASAVLPMAALARAARGADLSRTTVPALALYALGDRVVDPAETRSVMGRWGAPHRLIELSETGDPDRHTLAGDVLSPGTTANVAARIVYWLESLGLGDPTPTAALDGLESRLNR